MRINQRNGLWIIVGGLGWGFAACSPAPTDNTSDNESTFVPPVVESTVEILEPDESQTSENLPGLKVVAIAETGGIEAEYFALSEEGQPSQLTGLESTTGTDEFFTRFDEQGQTEQLIVGDDRMDLIYNEDGSINYIIRQGELIIGSGIGVDRPEEQSSAERVDVQDIQECAEFLLTEAAGESAELRSCLLANDTLHLLAEASCVGEFVLVPSLQQASCNAASDTESCTSLLDSAVSASGFFAQAIAAALRDFADQLGVAGNCPTTMISANLVFNGSFETGPEPGSYTPYNPGSAYIPGWVVTRGQIDYVGTDLVASEGLRCIDLDGTPGNGGIAQTIATVPGATYTLFFNLGGNTNGGPTIKKLQVAAAGQTQDYSFDITGHSATDPGWITQAFEFVAAGEAATIEFYSLDEPGTYGPVIDQVIVTGPQPSTSVIRSSFDESTEGWAIAYDATLVQVNSGGDPGGYAEATDLAVGQNFHFVAPARYLGNRSNAYGQTLSFDMKHNLSTGSVNQLVVLQGGGLELYITQTNPGADWTHYELQLSTGNSWQSAGALATDEEILTVLSNLTELWILGEFSGGVDVTGLDNVVLGIE
ncbi:MAG: hypothetical protein HJJLKODD_01216 [Phycisphaerae bacterium]|nr:hypothetical protein [Phycisphaerae bacterium]